MKTNKTRKSNKIMALLIALALTVTVFTITGNSSKASDEAEFGDGYYMAEESAELAGEAEVLASLVEEEPSEELVEETVTTEEVTEETALAEPVVEEPVIEEAPVENPVEESPVEEIPEDTTVEEPLVESPVETPVEEETADSSEIVKDEMNDFVDNDENNQELEKELEDTVEATEEVVEETVEAEEAVEETAEEAMETETIKETKEAEENEETTEKIVETEKTNIKMTKNAPAESSAVTEEDATEEPVVMENMNGVSVAPTFEMSDGNTSFCVEAEKTHPSDGIEYEASMSETVQENYEDLKGIFVNKYLIEEEGETEQELLNKTTQQAIWSKTDSTTDYRTNTLVWLGQSAVDLFDRLLSWVDTSLFNISFVEYTTEKTDAKGERYQTLLAACVTEIVEDEPEEINPTIPEEVPEEIIPEPTPEIPTPEEPTPQPEPEKAPVKNPAPVPEVVEPTPEVAEPQPEITAEPVMLSYRPTAETGVLSWTGTVHTGDTANIALYAGLLLVSGFAAAAMIIKGRKNK